MRLVALLKSLTVEKKQSYDFGQYTLECKKF